MHGLKEFHNTWNSRFRITDPDIKYRTWFETMYHWIGTDIVSKAAPGTSNVTVQRTMGRSVSPAPTGLLFIEDLQHGACYKLKPRKCAR